MKTLNKKIKNKENKEYRGTIFEYSHSSDSDSDEETGKKMKHKNFFPFLHVKRFQ